MSGFDIPGDIYAWVIVFILPINSAINPILYTISSIRFRVRILFCDVSSAIGRPRSCHCVWQSSMIFVKHSHCKNSDHYYLLLKFLFNKGPQNLNGKHSSMISFHLNYLCWAHDYFPALLLSYEPSFLSCPHISSTFIYSLSFQVFVVTKLVSSFQVVHISAFAVASLVSFITWFLMYKPVSW